MARRAWPWIALLGQAAGAATGCEGTEVGNPVEQTPLTLLARSSDEGRVQLGAEPGGDAGSATAVGIDALWVVLGDLRFVMDEDCASDRDTRITVRGPIVADLSAGPTELDALLADGAYCRVRVPLARAQADDLADDRAPDALDGQSVLLEGRRPDGTAFSILSRIKRELELRTRGEPFTLERASRAMILSLDVAAWLDGVDLDGAVPDASGTVVIDEAHDRARLAAFEDNLAASLRLYRDLDEDGTLDDRELSQELAGSAP